MTIEDRIIKKLDDITNPNSEIFDKDVYNTIEKDAYFISERDENKLPAEQYWDLSKQYFYARVLKKQDNGSQYKDVFDEQKKTIFSYASHILDTPNLDQLIEKHFNEFKEPSEKKGD